MIGLTWLWCFRSPCQRWRAILITYVVALQAPQALTSGMFFSRSMFYLTGVPISCVPFFWVMEICLFQDACCAQVKDGLVLQGFRIIRSYNSSLGYPHPQMCLATGGSQFIPFTHDFTWIRIFSELLPAVYIFMG
jgi:hypothetical protein